jgi:hypothetical protein
MLHLKNEGMTCGTFRKFEQLTYEFLVDKH